MKCHSWFKNEEYVCEMYSFNWVLLPLSVYLGGHWCHLQDKMDQAFPFGFVNWWKVRLLWKKKKKCKTLTAGATKWRHASHISHRKLLQIATKPWNLRKVSCYIVFMQTCQYHLLSITHSTVLYGVTLEKAAICSMKQAFCLSEEALWLWRACTDVKMSVSFQRHVV